MKRSLPTITGFVLFLALMGQGCANLAGGNARTATPANDAASPPQTNLVQDGDLVEVHYTVHLQNGDLVYASRRSEFDTVDTRYRALFVPPRRDAGEVLLAGGKGPVPGIGQVVKGLEIGEQSVSVIPAKHAFGAIDPQKILQFPSRRVQPLAYRMEPSAYVQRFNAFPLVGDRVPVTPYYDAEVTAVARDHVVLAARAESGRIYEDDFGSTRLIVEDDRIQLVLSPRVGAAFHYEDERGRIVAANDDHFEVDFNHPLAGQALYANLKIEGLTKASAFDDIQVEWIEDHDKGYELAAARDKPQVLVLYAKWCGWSKKLIEESLEDPRVKMLRDDFVWVKVDSDSDRAYKEYYDQEGFPMVLILTPEGDVLKRLEGYKDAPTLLKALNDSVRDRETG